MRAFTDVAAPPTVPTNWIVGATLASGGREALADGEEVLEPFLLSYPCHVTAIHIDTGATGATTWAVGIRDHRGRLVEQVGTIATSTTGVKTVTCSIQLDAGVWAVAAAKLSGTGSVWYQTGVQSPLFPVTGPSGPLEVAPCTAVQAGPTSGLAPGFAATRRLAGRRVGALLTLARRAGPQAEFGALDHYYWPTLAPGDHTDMRDRSPRYPPPISGSTSNIGADGRLDLANPVVFTRPCLVEGRIGIDVTGTAIGVALYEDVGDRRPRLYHSFGEADATTGGYKSLGGRVVVPAGRRMWWATGYRGTARTSRAVSEDHGGLSMEAGVTKRAADWNFSRGWYWNGAYSGVFPATVDTSTASGEFSAGASTPVCAMAMYPMEA